MDRPAIVWLRLDLRVADNPALSAAAARGAPVLPVYVLEDGAEDGPLGGAGRWWLHHSLQALSATLDRLGAPLVLLRGRATDLIPALARRTGAAAIFWNRRYEPAAVEREREVAEKLRAAGTGVESFNASLLFEPWEVLSGEDTPYKVFTPFWKACLRRPPPPRPLPAPARLRPMRAAPGGDRLADLDLLPAHPDWAAEFFEHWTPGEEGARQRLDRFLETLSGYAAGRDRPAKAATSRLSPHLHWGEIGPRQVWHAVAARVHADGDERSAEAFRAELGWREFCHHLLFHFPRIRHGNFRPEFDRIAWREDDSGFRAWSRGRTGFPIVDAGMRELWARGWMHNRVRMITASFLVKDLLVDWRRGMGWFEDTLLDADLANNAASWQWVAGSGADAAPFFRIFNPVLQGGKFDPDGAYVRRWVPELARLPPKWIHRPWAAPDSALLAAGVALGATYPRPIVDHATARQRALRAFAAIRKIHA